MWYFVTAALTNEHRGIGNLKRDIKEDLTETATLPKVLKEVRESVM